MSRPDMSTIVEVSYGSRLAAEVRHLWRAHSDTLGFMPEGGFDDAMRRRELLAATDGSVALAGYVLFRSTSKSQVVIVHLCVSSKCRGQGVARALFDAVRDRAEGKHEIRLRCRRDFAANALWPRLGFLAITEEPGRAAGATLTIWRYELAQLPLLAAINKCGRAKAVPVTIDANVFFDLGDERSRPTESQGLLADWFQEFAELCVTGELLNEIDRCKDPIERRRQRARFANYRQLPRAVAQENNVFPLVKGLLPQDTRPRTLSDARQLAMAIAGAVTFFVTRDVAVLEIADILYEQFGMEVLSPHEVIRRFDELRREQDYRPHRLFVEHGIRMTSARAGDLDRIINLLHHGEHLDEPRRKTSGTLRAMLAHPTRFTISIVDHCQNLLAIYVTERSFDGTTFKVPYFAVDASSLGRTASHHYAEHLVNLALNVNCRIIVVERAVRVDDALSEAGFWFEEGVGWVKLAVPISSDAAGVASAVERLGRESSTAKVFAERIAYELRAVPSTTRDATRPRGHLVAVERALWPVKILQTRLPCYVVPIQPRWAKELFDRQLAEGTLFGADPRLVLNSENVYYRAAKPAIVSAPARVLWYVSYDRSYAGSMAVRACSYVDEVVVGPAKDLFRRFRRLGVYQWSDVLLRAHGEPQKEIMAFRFSKTELFTHPVGWDDTQALLTTHAGRRSQFQGPVAVSEECFFAMYHLGVQGQGDVHAP